MAASVLTHREVSPGENTASSRLQSTPADDGFFTTIDTLLTIEPFPTISLQPLVLSTNFIDFSTLDGIPPFSGNPGESPIFSFPTSAQLSPFTSFISLTPSASATQSTASITISSGTSHTSTNREEKIITATVVPIFLALLGFYLYKLYRPRNREQLEEYLTEARVRSITPFKFKAIQSSRSTDGDETLTSLSRKGSVSASQSSSMIVEASAGGSDVYTIDEGQDSSVFRIALPSIIPEIRGQRRNQRSKAAPRRVHFDEQINRLSDASISLPDVGGLQQQVSVMQRQIASLQTKLISLTERLEEDQLSSGA